MGEERHAHHKADADEFPELRALRICAGGRHQPDRGGKRAGKDQPAGGRLLLLFRALAQDQPGKGPDRLRRGLCADSPGERAHRNGARPARAPVPRGRAQDPRRRRAALPHRGADGPEHLRAVRAGAPVHRQGRARGAAPLPGHGALPDLSRVFLPAAAVHARPAPAQHAAALPARAARASPDAPGLGAAARVAGL